MKSEWNLYIMIFVNNQEGTLPGVAEFITIVRNRCLMPISLQISYRSRVQKLMIYVQ